MSENTRSTFFRPDHPHLQMKGWLPALGLLLAVALAYGNSFPGAFHFDDYPLLLENPRVTQAPFRYDSFLEHYGGRPLTLWTFHWNYRLAGEEPASYHLVSVALHGVVTLLLFLLVRRFCGDTFLAFSTALIFALHPLQTQAVNYIWSRSVLLMGVFGLLSLSLIHRSPWGALLLLQLAVWARTEALVLAVVLVGMKREFWKPVVSLAAANLALFALSVVRYQPRGLAWNHADPVGFWTTQGVAFWKYLGLMVWPRGLTIDPSLESPPAFLGLLAGAAVLAMAAFALSRLRGPSLAAISVGWILALLAPSLLVPSSDLFNESHAYLALAGFALGMGGLLEFLSSPSRRWLRPALLAGLVLWMLPHTLARNRIWNSDVLLWQEAAARNPAQARVHYNLGASLARTGRIEEACRSFQTAFHLQPQESLTQAALGYCAEKAQDPLQAEAYYRRALELDPGNEYARQGYRRTRQPRETSGNPLYYPLGVGEP